MSDDIEIKRLRWHSRRGMLELDVILMPFIDEAYMALTEADKALYSRLLEQEDTDLFAWFIEREVSGDAELARMVEIVLDHARTRKL